MSIIIFFHHCVVETLKKQKNALQVTDTDANKYAVTVVYLGARNLHRNFLIRGILFQHFTALCPLNACQVNKKTGDTF